MRGLAAPELTAQALPVRDGFAANQAPYLYAAADFGIDPLEVTFAKDIVPILQRSCQDCHSPGGGGPQSLITYEEVRAWAPLIKYRTAIRDRIGAMPPWYIEKNIGVQHFKDDPSLSDEDLAKIQAWVDNGTPEGDLADMPPPREFGVAGVWKLGEPDLILRSPDMTMPAVGSDRWGIYWPRADGSHPRPIRRIRRGPGVQRCSPGHCQKNGGRTLSMAPYDVRRRGTE